MTTITLPVAAFSVRSTKPTTRYGSPASLPLKQSTYRVLARASMARVPADATITSAVLKFYMTTAGDRTVQAQALTNAFSASTTWSNQPTATGTVYSAASGVSRWVEIDVTLPVR